MDGIGSEIHWTDPSLFSCPISDTVTPRRAGTQSLPAERSVGEADSERLQRRHRLLYLLHRGDDEHDNQPGDWRSRGQSGKFPSDLCGPGDSLVSFLQPCAVRETAW